MSRRLALFVVLLLSAHRAAAGPLFEDVGARIGLDHQYLGGWEHFVGGGVAAFDCDGDHLPELYAAGGEAEATLLRNRSAGDRLDFVVGTPVALRLTAVIGAYPLHIDGDEYMDLAVLRVGENVLMRGGPDCDFEPFPASLGFRGGDRWTTAFSATWEEGASLPTLAFGNYVDRDDPEGPFEACDRNELHRPNGASYVQPITLAPGYCALSMLFSDWGRRGRADLRVSNDRHYYVRGGSEQMWAMEPVPRLMTGADGWRKTAIWGMGVASRDIDRDGMPEVYLTSMGDQILQRIAPGADGPTFADAPFSVGAAAHRPHIGDDGRPSTGWHAAFGDIDNDGFEDLFVAKGNVEQMPSNAMRDPNNLLIGRPDGRFEERAADAGVASMARGRGAALVDLDLDGRLDLAVVNRRAPMEIYRNVTPDAAGWLLLAIEQAAPNVGAVGAWVEVETESGRQTREITVGGGHAGGDAGTLHFGLGDAGTARFRVIWPGRAASPWRQVSSGARLRVTRSGDDLVIAPIP